MVIRRMESLIGSEADSGMTNTKIDRRGCDIDKVVVVMMEVEVVVGAGGQLLEGDVLVIQMTKVSLVWPRFHPAGFYLRNGQSRSFIDSYRNFYLCRSAKSIIVVQLSSNAYNS